MLRPLMLVAAATLPALAAAAEPVKVRYGMNWVPQGEHGGFYQAVADGEYAKCGLEVELVPGGPQVNNRALMLAGKIDFFMGSTMGALNAAEQGVPTVMVAALFQKDPQVLMTHPGRVTGLDAMDGMTLMVGNDSFATWYRWGMSALGWSEGQRAVYAYSLAPFLADKDMAVQGYATSDPLIVEREAGWAPDVFLLADAGYQPYSTTIEAMRATVAERPEVVQCFVDGSIRGWYSYLYGDASAGRAAIKAANPEMTDALLDFSLAQMKALGIVDSGDSLQKGIGVITAERVRAFYDQMVAAGVLAPGLDLAPVADTRFTGKGVGLDLKPAP